MNKVRITNYDGKDTVSNHSSSKNVYMISSAILEADVVISLPKPKTHRIAGYTAALKNFIGINTRKEYLPHHKIGAHEHGGDEYSGNHRFLKWVNSKSNDLRNHAVKHGNRNITLLLDKIGRTTGRTLDRYEKERYKFGMWYGNDTIWRTILDINHAVIYADSEGTMQEQPQRKVIYVGDMIVCGEGEGPLRPSYRKLGGLFFSESAVEFDRFVVRIMGFDWYKIPTIRNAMSDERLGSQNVDVFIDSNDKRFEGNVDAIESSFNFIPTSGWRGYI